MMVKAKVHQSQGTYLGFDHHLIPKMKMKDKVPQSKGTYLGFDHHLIPLD